MIIKMMTIIVTINLDENVFLIVKKLKHTLVIKIKIFLWNTTWSLR